MIAKTNEKGQALIIIALAGVAIFAFAALAIDGSRLFENKRHAQNAADTAALAGALAHARNNNVTTTALNRAASNGFNNNGTNNTVTVTIVNSPAGVCPANTKGKDITVKIVSTIDTTFARVINRPTLTSAVSATARTCGSYYGPPFDGNAIVALAPTGKGYEGTGTPDWNISGGGIFSNSTSSNAAYCNGASDITAPSVTVAGGTDFNCHGVNIASTTQGAPQYSSTNIAGFMPRQPACNGTAYQSAGKWHPQSGADGSRVAFSGNMDFAPGLYCVTNSPGPYHGQISGSEVTFYVLPANFSLKFNGGGNMTASAPTDPNNEYKGILLYLAPQFDANGNLLNTQAIDMRGNGTGNVTGTIFAPSADVTMFGNSGTGAFNSQIIAYHVDSGGNANITITYNPNDNFIDEKPIVLSLLK
jgi:Flp pilus assembly protein TadG